MDQNSNIQVKPRALKLKGVSFAWQQIKMLQKIRDNYQGEKLTTALAIYTVMTELASLEGRGQHKHVNRFKAYYTTIADRSGKSRSTVKRYLAEFKAANIISWENKRSGITNLANVWILLAYSQVTSEPTSVHNDEPVINEFIERSNINNKKEWKITGENNLTSISSSINKKRNKLAN